MTVTDPKAFWNARYEAPGYLFGTAPNRFLADCADYLKPPMKALSVADGEGRNSVWLAEQGLDVTAVEFSPVALAKAHQLAQSRQVAPVFIEADILAWEWPTAAYDVVAAIFIQFLNAAERQVLFPKIAAALRPGGLLLMQGYTPKQLEFKTGGPSAVENLYTASVLRGAFPELEITVLREHVGEVAEGAGHAGRSALIDFIARKPV